jgi:hypothetical protein
MSFRGSASARSIAYVNDFDGWNLNGKRQSQGTLRSCTSKANKTTQKNSKKSLRSDKNKPRSYFARNTQKEIKILAEAKVILIRRPTERKKKNFSSEMQFPLSDPSRVQSRRRRTSEEKRLLCCALLTEKKYKKREVAEVKSV